jgi:hypothetical protein
MSKWQRAPKELCAEEPKGSCNTGRVDRLLSARVIKLSEYVNRQPVTSKLHKTEVGRTERVTERSQHLIQREDR